MKLMKRVFLILLAVVVFASCGSFSGIMASAEETSKHDQSGAVSEGEGYDSTESSEGTSAEETSPGVIPPDETVENTEEKGTNEESDTAKSSENENGESSTGADAVTEVQLPILEAADAAVSYCVHMQSYGWLDWSLNGAENGKPDEGKRLEAIMVKAAGVEGLGVAYQVFNSDGWTEESADGKLSGTVGEGKQVEALRMRLTGTAASGYDIYYRVYVNEYGWLDWSWNYNIVGSDHSYNKSLEAIQVVIQKKGTVAPGPTSNPFLDKGEVDFETAVKQEWISYGTYVNGRGWLSNVNGGMDSGDAGSGNMLEAVRLSLNQDIYKDSGIKYQVQMQTYGWLSAEADGGVCGKPDSGKRIEAIEISLTGSIADACDIYYRANVEGYGWLDWAKNGATAGSVEMKKKMLSYQAVLVKKGASAPGPTARPAVYGTGDNGYPNTHVNTGNMAEDIIAAAMTQKGYAVPEGQNTKYGLWYNTYIGATGDYYPSAPWCAMFVSWCADQAGISGSIVRRTASTVNMAMWYQNSANPGSWHDRGNYTPQEGDLIFFKYSTNNNYVNHVGIVTGVSGGYVYTIEGNHSDSVAEGKYALNSSLIVGYATPAYKKESGVSYSVNVEGSGWQKEVSNGISAGTTGSAKRLQSIRISLPGKEYTGSITYRTHMQTYGWGSWVSEGQASGIADGDKRMEAVEIKLTGQMAEKYDVYYRIHCQTFGWLGWAKNGESAGSESYAKRVEAIEIQLVSKGGAAPGPTDNAFKKPTGIFYQTHIQSSGWGGFVENGEWSGTTGSAKRLEAIEIELRNMGISGDVSYRTYVQTYRWQEWSANGALNGTTGQSKRLEAIQIKLSGDIADKYDIYYRVHSQTYGWLGWAKNGENAGTADLAKRLEAVQIVLVEKGHSAPGNTSGAFIQG